MLIRATIVLLAVLNLGTLAWWLWRPAPVQPVVEQPVGVPRLVLLEEIEPPAAPPVEAAPERVVPEPAEAAPADSEPAPEAEPPAPPRREEPGETRATPPQRDRADEPPITGAARCDGAGDGEARGWRVFLPPAHDLASAEATARAIGEAGFGDYLVLRDGDTANGIALGMYSTEAAAQRRRAALDGKGFPARCARIPG
jgi:hypothetical protein